MVNKMELGSSGKHAITYSGQCEILHVHDNNCDILEHIRSENCIMSTLSSSLEAELRPKGLALKFTTDGLETYWFQNRPFKISTGKYLLVNDSVPVMDVVIKNVSTLGVCVDIDTQLVNDLLYQLFSPNDLESYNNINRYLLSPELFVREAVAGKPLKTLLNQFAAISVSENYTRPALELIYDLITVLVQENLSFVTSYYKLQATKLSTRKELYRRVLLGKEALDNSIFSEMTITEAADISCLSEFRFYRLFKQCFGVSPYHYLLNRRIESSIELKKQGLTWNEIAHTLNFTDLAAFSNCFKKINGVPPSKFSL
ncbi:AraC family transcriptional regulator [Pontibacter sp. FD36]|uniref:helix-turn-helix domain-containing protein n=1 Tax=Pontibacter sp. FD36 TaxID=2789860 RepID=UPI0018A949F3|nr:AraC family transcriptional regulator [Pontibacter sp. FD36]MBF8964070.1 AraC family transcriptional regulator [Pontibacter sp. FD36]